MTEPDHERIWLEPRPGDPNEEREWCENDVWSSNPDYDVSATEYVRADLVEALCKEMASALAAAAAREEGQREVLWRLIDSGDASSLRQDIDAWISQEVREKAGIPDFWDELSTTERLADALWEQGYRKLPPAPEDAA